MMTFLLQTTLDFGSAAQAQNLTGAENTAGGLISGVLSAVMAIGALLVLLYYVWAGIEWITAGGDSSKIEKARTKIMQSTIGLIVLSMAFAFFFALQQFLGIEIFDPGKSFFTSGARDVGRSSTGAELEQGRSGSTSDPNQLLRDALEERAEQERRDEIIDALRNRN